MVQPLEHSTYLDYTSYRTTVATNVADAFGLYGGVTPAPTTNVALILPRANDPTALLTSDWATRQTTLAQLRDSDTLWSTYGATSSDYTAALQTLDNLGIQVIGNAAGTDGYVTSQESRTIWVSLTSAQFDTLFGTPLHQSNSDYGTLVYWNGSLSVPDDLNISGLWFDTAPMWGTYPAVSDMSGGLRANLHQGSQSIGNDLGRQSLQSNVYPGNIADWFYNFPLADRNVQTATIGLLEPGSGDVLPSNATWTFQEGLDSLRENAGVPTPGHYYNVAHNGQSYEWSNPGERTLDVTVVASSAPGSTIGLYAGSGFDGDSNANAYTAFQASFWDTIHDPSVVASSYSIFQQSKPGSPFATAVQELFTDAALRNITMVMANNDWGSSWNFGNGLANQAINMSSPYMLLVGGTSITTLEAAPKDPTVSDMPSKPESLLGHAMRGNHEVLWGLMAGGLMMLPSAVAHDDAAMTMFLESVWNEYYLVGDTLTDSFGIGDGGVDVTQPTPWYQTAFGLTPTSVNPGHETGRGTPDVTALAGGDMYYAGPYIDMQPGPTPPGGYYGTSAATPLWASLIAQIDTIFSDQGLPHLGFANDVLYQAAAIAPAAFNDITYGNNISSFIYGGPIDAGGTDITLTGLGYYAGPGYDLTSGLGSPNGTLLARALTAIAHSQMSFGSEPDMLDTDGSGHWTSGASQTLTFQTMAASDVHISVLAGSSFGQFSSHPSDTWAWTSRLAQQSLQADFDPHLVRMFDKQTQGAMVQWSLSAGDDLAVAINSTVAGAMQGTLTSPFGFADFMSEDGVVRVARSVAVAETAGASDDQIAIVRLRQNGENSLSVKFYQVDDFDGTINGLRPGETGYAAAVNDRLYHTVAGGTAIEGPGYGNYAQTALLNVDAGDLIAMELVNRTTGDVYSAFSQANELSNGQHVGHLWNYGVNTWGWEDSHGGGDHDFNDLVVGLDFTSASGHGWLV